MISDPQKEFAVIGYVVADTFWKIPEHALIDSEAFTEPVCRIIYSAARRLAIAGAPCHVEAVNDFIRKNGLEKEMQKCIDSTNTALWTKWSEEGSPHYDISQAFEPETRQIEYSLQVIGEHYIGRQRVTLQNRFASGDISKDELDNAWEKIHGRNGCLPPIVDAYDLCRQEDDTPPEIVHGIFHKGTKVMVAGGSKSFKTWQLIQLAVCVSEGIPWLKFPTTRGRVLYLNFELPAWAMRKRIREIRAALSVTATRGDLDVWNLRGYSASAEKILPLIARAASKRGYCLIILDPLYKMLGERDENSATAMTSLMNEVEQITVQTGAANAFGSHFSKGNQSAKNAIDRMSGSGVLARDPDCMIVCTEHAEDDAFTVNLILRNLPPQLPFTMKFMAPLMVVAELDPDDLKQPAGGQGGGRPDGTPGRYAQIILALQESKGMSQSDLQKATNIPLSTLKRDLTALAKTGKIFHSSIDHLWALR
jgi:hypothetical protein